MLFYDLLNFGKVGLNNISIFVKYFNQYLKSDKIIYTSKQQVMLGKEQAMLRKVTCRLLGDDFPYLLDFCMSYE